MLLPVWVEAKDIHEVAQSREWLLLLHTKPKSQSLSEVDGPLFFFDSKNGPHNPGAELTASIKAFETNDPIKGQIVQSARCAFPARRRFIAENLNLKFEDNCPQFEEWKAKLNPQKLSIVLAAPYMGSPSSMFGHVFLKIHIKDSKNENLDWALGFEAVTQSSSEGVMYALRGLAGVFPGVFTLLPYHLKINQYSNVDNRDLWEFDLDFNSEQLSRMIEHLWELQNTYFDYFFFDENCAYHLLSLLEVANPSLKLRDEFAFKAIPIDVLLEVLKQNAKGIEGTRRPAILTQLRIAREKMSASEIELFHMWHQRIKELPEGLPVAVLDNLLLWEQFQRFQKSQKLLDPDATIDYRLLSLRAKAGASQFNLADSSRQSIEAKASNKVSVYGFKENSLGLGVAFRPAFHSLLEWTGSMQSLQSLELLELRGEWEAAKNFRMEALKFVRVENLSPFTLLHPNFSWFVETGLKRPWEERCLKCINFSAEAGAGYNFEILKQNYLYVLPSIELRVGPDYGLYHQGLPYLRSGVISAWGKIKLQAEHHLLFKLPSHNGSKIENFDQRLVLKGVWGEQSWDAGLLYRSHLSKSLDSESRVQLDYSRYY